MKTDLAVFKALSDETRLRILFLLTTGELCVCELVAVLEMPQGKISRHLSVLKNAGLVSDRREGTWIYYRLPAPDTDLKTLLMDYFSREQAPQPPVSEDFVRLESLTGEGKICIPRPSGVLSQN